MQEMKYHLIFHKCLIDGPESRARDSGETSGLMAIEKANEKEEICDKATGGVGVEKSKGWEIDSGATKQMTLQRGYPPKAHTYRVAIKFANGQSLWSGDLINDLVDARRDIIALLFYSCDLVLSQSGESQGLRFNDFLNWRSSTLSA